MSPRCPPPRHPVIPTEASRPKGGMRSGGTCFSAQALKRLVQPNPLRHGMSHWLYRAAGLPNKQIIHDPNPR